MGSEMCIRDSTWTSRKKGQALKGVPTDYMKKLTVVASDPLTAEEATRPVLFDKILELRGDEK